MSIAYVDESLGLQEHHFAFPGRPDAVAELGAAVRDAVQAGDVVPILRFFHDRAPGWEAERRALYRPLTLLEVADRVQDLAMEAAPWLPGLEHRITRLFQRLQDRFPAAGGLLRGEEWERLGALVRDLQQARERGATPRVRVLLSEAAADVMDRLPEALLRPLPRPGTEPAQAFRASLPLCVPPEGANGGLGGLLDLLPLPEGLHDLPPFPGLERSRALSARDPADFVPAPGASAPRWAPPDQIPGLRDRLTALPPEIPVDEETLLQRARDLGARGRTAPFRQVETWRSLWPARREALLRVADPASGLGLLQWTGHPPPAPRPSAAAVV